MAEILSAAQQTPEGVHFWRCDYGSGRRGVVGWHVAGLLMASWNTDLQPKTFAHNLGVEKAVNERRAIVTRNTRHASGIDPTPNGTVLREIGFTDPLTVGRISVHYRASSNPTSAEAIVWQAGREPIDQPTIAIYGPSVLALVKLSDSLGVSQVSEHLPQLFEQLRASGELG